MKENNNFSNWFKAILQKNIFVKKGKIYDDVELITDRIFFSYRAGDFERTKDDQNAFSAKIEEIFEDQIEEGTKNFIMDVYNKKQFEDFALESIDFFEYFKGEIFTLKEISVFTAVNISDILKNEISQKICAKVDDRWVSFSTDQSMYAGIRIEDGESTSDYSLRRFLTPALTKYISNNIQR